eukprot:scaffold2590_cov160-Amphora_coffeaeformis.AAC.15
MSDNRNDGDLHKRSLSEEMSHFERDGKKKFQVMSIEHSLQQQDHRNRPRVPLLSCNEKIGILGVCIFLLYAAFAYAGSGKHSDKPTDLWVVYPVSVDPNLSFQISLTLTRMNSLPKPGNSKNGQLMITTWNVAAINNVSKVCSRCSILLQRPST